MRFEVLYKLKRIYVRNSLPSYVSRLTSKYIIKKLLFCTEKEKLFAQIVHMGRLGNLLDLFGGGRLEVKWSYFRPLAGFLRAHSYSYVTEKRHKVGRKEPISARYETRRSKSICHLLIFRLLCLCGR